jgi:dihydrofolate reductase
VSSTGTGARPGNRAGRRLILQMQSSLDGFVDAARPGISWQEWDWGDDTRWDGDLRRDFNAVFESVTTILLSRPMLEGGYLDHWQRAARAHRGDPHYRFAQRIMDVDKVLVSRRLAGTSRESTRVLAPPLSDAVTALKAESGGDIICFGGVRFASALLEANLVDELQLFVNPTALGAGATIFAAATGQGWRFSLEGSMPYQCGIVVSRYRSRRD